MPAPSVDTLRDFESQFDACLAAILAPLAAAHELQLAGHGNTDDLEIPRLEYEFAESEAPSAGTIPLVRENGAQSAFTGHITIRHVYDHAKITAAAAGAVRGGLRTLFSPETAAITTTNLPYLKIEGLGVVSAQRARFKDEKEKLLTEFFMTISLLWIIREEAWLA